MPRNYISIILSSLLLLFTIGLQSQNERTSKKYNTMDKLSKSLESESDESVALNYEKLAKEFSEKGEYAKAEENLNKARKLYSKMKMKEKVAEMDKELAKVQEAQNKIGAAISSLQSAQKTSDVQQQSINANNMARLSNKSNPKAQSKYIQSNIDLYKSSGQKEEAADAYQQMAKVNLDMGNKDEAIENLGMALKNVENKADAKIKITKEIAGVYEASQQYDKAIDINKDLLKDAQKEHDTKREIEQLQSLSANYINADEPQKGVESLQLAYALSVEKGHTLDARQSLELLVAQYQKEKKQEKALEVYANFVNGLESLIKSDSSLIDAKTFQVHEARISQLEKERTLKDELIKKTNRFNYVLIFSILLIFISLIFIAKSLFSIKKKNKRIALQSLRREMNPHFIFNSLNSVNQYIAQNNELEANKYLSSYSKLMRNIMENSNKDFISLSAELEQLKEYLDLEHLRFGDKFTYHIDVDKSLDTDTTFVPNMLIQPQLENAIWHGLRYKDGNGRLWLTIKSENATLCVTIEDNGIGRKQSHELKTKHQLEHKSRGLTNTTERISLLNSLYNCSIKMDIIDKEGDEHGVIVVFHFSQIQHEIHRQPENKFV